MSTINPMSPAALSQGFSALGTVPPTGFFARMRAGRIGQWLRWSRVDGAEAETDDANDTLDGEATCVESSMELSDAVTLPGPGGPRGGGFLRAFSRRRTTIEQLETGVTALAELMNSIQQHLERQSARQDEMVRCLANLPAALQQLPEAQRLQGETLQAMVEQIERHADRQNQVADLLERLSRAESERGRALDALQDRVDVLSSHDQSIAQNLGAVGTAMQTSATILHQLQDNLDERDGRWEKILRRQNLRFTLMLSVTLGVSLIVAGAVAAAAYLLVVRM